MMSWWLPPFEGKNIFICFKFSLVLSPPPLPAKVEPSLQMEKNVKFIYAENICLAEERQFTTASQEHLRHSTSQGREMAPYSVRGIIPVSSSREKLIWKDLIYTFNNKLGLSSLSSKW